MGAHQSPWFLVCVLAALDICFLQATKSQVPLSIPSTDLPNLLTRLRQIPDYSMFRDYIIKYQLSKKIQVSNGYTIFAPNNEAIKKYIQEKGHSSLDENLIKYHIVLGEQLFKDDLHSGMHRETLLGISYKVVFFLHNGQLYVNDAPINNTNLETNNGVIHGLTKVLEIQNNRCDTNETSIQQGECMVYCGYPSTACPLGTTPMTLSGQDIEYHLSNGSVIFYESFINTSTLQTRIGHPLRITYDTSGNTLVKECTNLTCLVEGRNILQWNIYATNGIIHVISRPLRAPAVPLSTRHPGVAAGIFFIILAVVALIVFAVCASRKSGKGFLHFRKLRLNKNMDVLRRNNPSNSNSMLKGATASTASSSDPTYNVLLDLEDQEFVGDEPQE